MSPTNHTNAVPDPIPDRHAGTRGPGAGAGAAPNQEPGA